MKIDGTKLLTAGILIALAAGSWWITRITTTAEWTYTGKQRHDPDYIVENFHATQMASDGQPQMEISGQRLKHFADDGASLIDKPYVIQYNPGRAATHAVAVEGYLPKEFDVIRLVGDVHVAKGRDPRDAGGDVHAETLTLKLDRSE